MGNMENEIISRIEAKINHKFENDNKYKNRFSHSFSTIELNELVDVITEKLNDTCSKSINFKS